MIKLLVVGFVCFMTGALCGILLAALLSANNTDSDECITTKKEGKEN